MRENVEQSNFEYKHFSRSGKQFDKSKNMPCKADETVSKWKILSREATGNTGRKIWHTGVPKEIYQTGRLSASPKLDKYA